MADDRIEIVFGADIAELVAGVSQARNQVDALVGPVKDLGTRFDVAFAQAAQAGTQHAGQMQRDWTEALATIDRSLDTMLKGVLMGTQTWQQAVSHLFDNLALAFIEAVAKMMVQWAAFTALTAAFGSSPIASPFAAGAGGLGGIVAGVGGLLGFAGGAWSVPEDMVAVIHQGEMILPADVAAGVRAGTTSAAAAPSGFALNVTVQAMDAAGVAQWANANARTLAATIARYMSANPSMQGSY
ncbi:MAG TPA: hypothetical protein VMU87_22735 [Stellaceae bacterium]|nr:hypothetical protein [Stellaceae bacterium]